MRELTKETDVEFRKREVALSKGCLRILSLFSSSIFFVIVQLCCIPPENSINRGASFLFFTEKPTPSHFDFPVNSVSHSSLSFIKDNQSYVNNSYKKFNTYQFKSRVSLSAINKLFNTIIVVCTAVSLSKFLCTKGLRGLPIRFKLKQRE